MLLDEEVRDDASFRAKDLGWSAIVHQMQLGSVSVEEAANRIGVTPEEFRRMAQTSIEMNIEKLGLMAEALDCELKIELIPRGETS